MAVLIDKIVKEQGFRYTHSMDDVTITSRYNIHAHDVYEMVIFLKGDTSFCVEGKVYPLSPYDIMISRPGEMHQIYHHSSATRIQHYLSQDNGQASRSAGNLGAHIGNHRWWTVRCGRNFSKRSDMQRSLYSV